MDDKEKRTLSAKTHYRRIQFDFMVLTMFALLKLLIGLAYYMPNLGDSANPLTLAFLGVIVGFEICHVGIVGIFLFATLFIRGALESVNLQEVRRLSARVRWVGVLFSLGHFLLMFNYGSPI